jgi:hypothetical protein
MLNNNKLAGFNHLEEYESQWGGLSHILWKKMFETTNQMGMLMNKWIIHEEK